MKLVNSIIIFFFSLLFLIACNSAEKLIRKGDASNAIGEYYDAGNYYKTAYRQLSPKDRTKRGEIAYKMAECFRKINYVPRALSAYQNAIRNNVTDSMAYLHLADMQRFMGNYKDAKENYILFLEKNPQSHLAQVGKKACDEAAETKERSSQYIVKQARAFNSTRSDYCAVLTGENFDQLFLTSTNKEALGDDISGITGMNNGDLFFSKKDEKNKWKRLESAEGINSEYDEGACSFSPDGKTMYLTICKWDPASPRYAEIYSSTRSDAKWSQPKKVELSSDTLSSYAHPAVSPDGNWLYFVSDFPGGYGGMDLWRVKMDEHGLGALENLGSDINTEGDEMFPTFRPSGELYFSSTGRGGLGGLDLYKAREDSAEQHWSVEHLPYPINSKGDDFSMTFEGLNNRGFFTSNRSGGKGWDKIYSFEHPEILQTVKGWVYEQDGYELPRALVYMVGDDGTNLKLNVKSDGSFNQVIQPNVHYILLATCKGYLNYKQELAVDTVSQSKEYVLQFPLPSITTPVLVRNVFYEFDKASITESSEEALKKLSDLLKENPNITIELGAHCDYRGNDEYNKRLSQRRAESVIHFLIKQGIEAERLTAKGYGEESPKVVNKKIAESIPFLQVKDTLSEQFISKLTEEQQEVCNAINRRTEFKVLRTTYGLFDETGKLKKNVLKNKASKNKEATKDSENSTIFILE